MKPGAANDTDGIAYNKVHKLEMQRPDHDVLEIATGYPVLKLVTPVLFSHHGRVRVHVTSVGTVVRFDNHISVKTVVGDPMATLTTTAAVSILRDRAVLATDVFVLASKVIGMTSSTIWLERG